MTALHLIAPDIPSLTVTQTGKDAFHLLGDHHVKHLPVVDEHRLVGILSEEDIFNHKLYEPISTYDFSLLRMVAVQAEEHLLEIMRVMGENRLTIIPVIDKTGNYLGLIRQNEVLRAFSEMGAFAEPGGVIVLSMPRRDYSLHLLARIVEDEDMKILSSFVSSEPISEMVEITLKVSRPEMSRVIAALERHQYNVTASYPDDPSMHYIQERYESLMNYLNT
jgi:acetoin utilization protein AcuB